MAVNFAPIDTAALSADDVAALAGIPTSIASDVMNRTRGMDAGIRPIGTHKSFVGVALTVAAMVGDNCALHFAASMARPGVVIVCDGRGDMSTALWGEMIHSAAAYRGVTAVVIDGCVRDIEALAKSAVPVWARGRVPAGPHKGWGGAINVPIQCGGCVVNANDVVLGDGDGVMIVPRALVPRVIDEGGKQIRHEQKMLQSIASGLSTIEILQLHP